MIVHNEYKQGDPDWMIARSGIPTASEFDYLLTPELEPRKANAEMPRSYLAKKLAERWLGGPIASLNTFDMEQGQILEQEAIPWLEFTSGITIERPAFITTDDGKIGCSPDGLMAGPTAHSGLELKCPMAETHCKYLLAGKLPKDYAAQVHGSLYVTGLKHWKFLSYRRRFPAFIIQVEFDEEINQRIGEVLEKFVQDLEGAWNQLCDMNGGPPKRPTNYVARTATPKREDMSYAEIDNMP